MRWQLKNLYLKGSGILKQTCASPILKAWCTLEICPCRLGVPVKNTLKTHTVVFVKMAGKTHNVYIPMPHLIFRTWGTTKWLSRLLLMSDLITPQRKRLNCQFVVTHVLEKKQVDGWRQRPSGICIKYFYKWHNLFLTTGIPSCQGPVYVKCEPSL